jgi:hypothetical protein
MSLEALRAAFPPGGLFAEKDWLLSPEPFWITDDLREELEKLGYRLNLFQRACNELYHQSVAGKQPPWIAEWLDRGKPAELIALGRERKHRADLPRVIRPDLVLTEEGFTLAETDSVPGGIGLTGWLNQTYTNLGFNVLGGSRGMIDGFREALGGHADILVSREAATYRPEMEWLAAECDGGLRVHEAETFTQNGTATLYRFFELFDLPNIPSAPALMHAAAARQATVTPPFKPYLEEKMWFALFWLQPLREFWRRELSERHFLKLQKSIPFTWILDPAPLPPHAVIPHLEVNRWADVAEFSQKQRDLILKISGFSELAWGSRSVELGSDLSQHDWRAALQHALAVFPEHPYLLQRFHKGRLVEQPYYERDTGQLQTMRGRVRLCPYYFVFEGKAHLRGALATVCPADKKLLHGMSDAILVPTAVKAASA